MLPGSRTAYRIDHSGRVTGQAYNGPDSPGPQDIVRIEQNAAFLRILEPTGQQGDRLFALGTLCWELAIGICSVTQSVAEEIQR